MPYKIHREGVSYRMEDDADNMMPVPLSALQHYSYCPRQCALIYVEQIFDENIFTMKGRWAHVKVDEEHVRSSAGHEVLTALPVWSDKHGLTGKCDVVELRDGLPYPVEFKHGQRAAHVWDELQLCAQGICLEEMFGVTIPEGAIYHISSRRRRVVKFTDELRQYVIDTAEQVRHMREQITLPVAVNDERCVHCSLNEACMPARTDGRHMRTWQDVLAEVEES